MQVRWYWLLDFTKKKSRPFLFYYKMGDRSIIFHWIRYLMPNHPVQYIPNTLFIVSHSLIAIEKPHSLQQSALVGDHNGRQILGLYHFVSEEFD